MENALLVRTVGCRIELFYQNYIYTHRGTDLSPVFSIDKGIKMHGGGSNIDKRYKGVGGGGQ